MNTFPGCEPVEPPTPSAEEQAERDRVEAACKAYVHPNDPDRAVWRHRVEEATRRRGLTQAQRDEEDRQDLRERFDAVVEWANEHPVRRVAFAMLVGELQPVGLAAIRARVERMEEVQEKIAAEEERAWRKLTPAQRREANRTTE